MTPVYGSGLGDLPIAQQVVTCYATVQFHSSIHQTNAYTPTTRTR